MEAETGISVAARASAVLEPVEVRIDVTRDAAVAGLAVLRIIGAAASRVTGDFATGVGCVTRLIVGTLSFNAMRVTVAVGRAANARSRAAVAIAC